MNMTRLLACLLVTILLRVAARGDGITVNTSNGSVTPPDSAFRDGVPVVTMKNLNEVEPRTAIYELPYVITNSGSYYLADTLDGVAGRNGIVVAAHDVRLDLNGFSIWGTNGANHGIVVSNGAHNISIRNGAVGEWPGWGILGVGSFNTEVSHVKLYQNGGGGIVLGSGGVVERCTAEDCGGPGIMVADAGTVRECRVGESDGQGIGAGDGSLVEGCRVSGSKADGILVMDYCTVNKCLSVSNSTNGISARWSCIIKSNNCGENGRGNRAGAGIYIRGDANRIENNNLTDNHIGLLLDRGGNRVWNNSIMSNGFGLQDKGDGNLIHANNVGWSESGTNYIFTGEPNFGQILQNPGRAFIRDNPWANFEVD